MSRRGEAPGAVVDAETLQKRIAAAMSEAELQRSVEELLRVHGWRWTHFRTAQTGRGAYVTALSGDKGFPDICACKPGTGRLLFAELKTEKGRTTVEQDAWLSHALGVADAAETYLWRPRDLLSGEIERVLGD